jgi:hypothetical protein
MFGVRHSLKYLIAIVVATTVVLVAVRRAITMAFVVLHAIRSVLLGSAPEHSSVSPTRRPGRDLRWAQR